MMEWHPLGWSWASASMDLNEIVILSYCSCCLFAGWGQRMPWSRMRTRSQELLVMKIHMLLLPIVWPRELGCVHISIGRDRGAYFKNECFKVESPYKKFVDKFSNLWNFGLIIELEMLVWLNYVKTVLLKVLMLVLTLMLAFSNL